MEGVREEGGLFFPARYFRSYLFGGQTTSYEHTNYVANNRKLSSQPETGSGNTGAGVRNKLDGSSAGTAVSSSSVAVAHRTDVVQRKGGRAETNY